MAFSIPNAATASFPAQAVPDATDILNIADLLSYGILPSPLDGVSALKVVPQPTGPNMTVRVMNTVQAKVTLTTALTNGQIGVVALAVTALPQACVSGQSIVIGGGTSQQTVTVSAAGAAKGATSIPVTSFTSNAAYGIGTSVEDQSWALGYVIMDGNINLVSPAQLTIAAANVNDRRDIIGWGVGVGFFVVPGTPCSVAGWTPGSGAAPPVKPSFGANFTLIAEIMVQGTGSSGTTSIQANNIIDKSNLLGGGMVFMPNANTSRGTTFGALISVLDAAGAAGNFIQTFDQFGNPIVASTRIGGWTVTGDEVRAGTSVFGPFAGIDGQTNPASFKFPSGIRIWSGAGVPTTVIVAGVSGIFPTTNDLYWNSSNLRWYVCTAGGSIPGTWRIQQLISPAAVNAPGATPAINTDNQDVATFTGIAAAITGFTVTGTQFDGQELSVRLTDAGVAETIAWGAKFEASGTVTLPTTTVAGVQLTCRFMYNLVTAKFRILAKS